MVNLPFCYIHNCDNGYTSPALPPLQSRRTGTRSYLLIIILLKFEGRILHVLAYAFDGHRYDLRRYFPANVS